MTFAELLSEVYIYTNRPDLVDETKSAVKSATIKWHHSDYYSKDIFETGISFDSEAYKHSLDIYSLYSNFRAWKYIKRVENADDEEGKFFDIISPEELLDSYGNNRIDVAYVAGRATEIKAAVQFRYLLTGFYVTPIVTEENYSSWIADLHPYIIIYEAARKVLDFTDEMEKANKMARLVREEFPMLKQLGLTDIGY